MRRLLLVLLCVCVATLSADNKGKGKGKGNQGKARPGAAVNVNFGASDVRAIREYYGSHPVSLPPGLQKKLSRGRALPPGWQKKLQPFPSDVAVRLGAPCAYCAHGVIDGYGVVYDKRTAMILDSVRLVGDILR